MTVCGWHVWISLRISLNVRNVHLVQNTPSWEAFSKTRSCSTIKLFFFFKYLIKLSGVTVLVQEKRRIYFAIELSLREISCFDVHAAHVRAPMTQKSCSVGMRNAILRNYLKLYREQRKQISQNLAFEGLQ